MNGIELLKYAVFGYSFLISLISFILSDDLRNPIFFKRCLIAGLFAFGLGILLELTDVFKLFKGMTLLLMSISLIYLVYFEALRRLFRRWMGTDPYITDSGSKNGMTPTNGFWTKFPIDRKIMWTDFLFSFAQALIPVFTIFGLMILIIVLNK